MCTWPVTRSWQERRSPGVRSVCWRSISVGAEQCSAPRMISTRHLPHTPSPSHEAAMGSPARRAATHTDSPGRTSTVRPLGNTIRPPCSFLL